VFPLCFVIMAVISAYTWSGFPYDNLCKDSEPLDADQYANDWELTVEGKNTTVLGFTLYSVPDIMEEFTISANSETYRFCNQDLRMNQEKSFPAIPSFQTEGYEWMTDDQERVTLVYGWTTVAVVALAVLAIVWRLFQWAANIVFGFYMPRGRDMMRNYSDIYAIEAYIPQVQSPLFEYVILWPNVCSCAALCRARSCSPTDMLPFSLGTRLFSLTPTRYQRCFSAGPIQISHTVTTT
jgi:hypothetical protein